MKLIVPKSPSPAKHIILIGFKNVGKSLIGQNLAKKLNATFIDLDDEVEELYTSKYNRTLTCGQIIEIHGEPFFRELESVALKLVIKLDSCVISLGGGTLSSEVNQRVVRDNLLLHVEAPRGVVFERIMVEGRPAIFDPTKDPYEAFSQLWDQRIKIYKKLATCRVDNSKTVEHAVNQAVTYLSRQQKAVMQIP